MAILKALQVLLMCSQGWELGEKTTSKSRLGRDLIVLGLQGNRELALPSPRSALNGRKLRSRPQTRGSRCGQDPVSFSSPFLPPYCLFSCDNIYAGWRAGNQCVCMCVVRLSPFFSLFLIFWPCCMVLGILVSQPRVKPKSRPRAKPPAVEAWILNHGTTREILWEIFFRQLHQGDLFVHSSPRHT